MKRFLQIGFAWLGLFLISSAGYSAFAPAGTISPDGTLSGSALSTTYGTASSQASFTFTASGLGATEVVTITAPTGFEVSLTSGSGFGPSTTKSATAGTIASTTVYVRLLATATVAGSPYSGNVHFSGAGGATADEPTAASNTVSKKTLTITSATANDKVYDGTNAATVTPSPTLNGVVGADVVNINGGATGMFASTGVASGISVTSNYSLGGADQGNYSLTQPTLTAAITVKTLTITGALANDKVYDGTNSATVTASPTLNGVVGADVVTINGGASGMFASTGVNNGISVTSNYSLGGADQANYTLTQPTLTANITAVNLTITGVTANNKVYDGGVTASLSGTPTLIGVLGSDVVSVSGGTATFTSNGTTAGTLAVPVTVTGYALGGAQGGNYTVSQPTGLTATIFAQTPSSHPTGMTFTNITNTTMRVNYSAAGNGSARVLVAKQGGVVSSNPVNGTDYSAAVGDFTNVTFSLGGGNVVVGVITSTSAGFFDVTNLTANLSYNFSIFEFNGSAGLESYFATPLAGGPQKTEDEPLNHVTALTATATPTAITLNWSGSAGSPAPSNYLILGKDLTNSGSYYAFSDGSAPSNTADNNLNNGGSPAYSGTHLNTFGTNTYNGWTGLTAGNLYEFEVVPYTTAGIINPDYKLSPAPPTVQVYTEPSASASAPTFSNITSTSIDVTLAGGTGLGPAGGYLVIRKTAAPTTAPSDGTSYSVGNLIGGNPVVYIGAAGTFTDGVLTAGALLPLTNYIYDVYVFSGTGTLTNFKTTSPGNGNTTTLCSPPVTQATAISFGASTASSVVVNITRGSGTNVLLLIKQGTASAVSPVPGTTYTASNTAPFTTGSTISSYRVAYNGTGPATTAITVSNLSGNTAYNFQAFEFNATGQCYLVSSPASNDFTTPSAGQTNTMTLATGSTLLSSIANSQGAGVVVFQWKVTDIGDDNTSSRISDLVLRPGSGNAISPFTDYLPVAGAELSDDKGSTPMLGTVASNTITFSSINYGDPNSGASITDLGSIPDNQSKTYFVKVWFNNNPSGALSPTTIDGQRLVLSLTKSDITVVTGKSGYAAGTIDSGGGGTNGFIDVQGTQINVNTAPQSNPSANVPLVPQPIYEITDVHGNRDRIGNAITVNTTPTNLGPTSAPSNFINGLADFTGSGFKFLNTGSSNMTVSITAPSLTSSPATSITVTASTNLGISTTTMSGSPLASNSTGGIVVALATNAVLGFKLQTTGTTLTLDQLNFTASTSLTGLVPTLRLYSNTIDSFLGATQVATSTSLTFSGLGLTLTGTPTYFFLLCDLYPSFPSSNPTISFQLPAGNFTTIPSSGETGTSQNGSTYTLHDGINPTISGITLPSTNPNHVGSVDFTVTFSENVTIANNLDFSVFGTAAGGTEIISHTGSNNVYTVTVSNISKEGTLGLTVKSTNGSIKDLGLNVLNAGLGVSSGTYQVYIPEPSSNPASFQITATTTTSMTLTWADVATYPTPSNYLITVERSGATATAPVDGPAIADQTDLINNTTGYINVGSGVQTYLFSSLLSGATYTFKIYPYTNSAPNIDYKTSSPASASGATLVASIGALASSPAVTASISSLTTSSYLPTPAERNMFLRVIDDSGNPAADNVPMLFSQFVITAAASTDNTIPNWSEVIQEAKLSSSYDITFATGVTTQLTTNITPNSITFNLPSGSGQIGEVTDDGTKYYMLHIRFKVPLDNTSGIRALIDNKRFEFELDPVTGVSYAPGSSQLNSVQSPPKGTSDPSLLNTNNRFDVQPSQLLFVQQPTTNTYIGNVMLPPVSIEATDVYGNRDLDNTSGVSITSSGTLQTTPISITLNSGFQTASVVHTKTGTNLALTATSGSLTPTGNSGNFDIITDNKSDIIFEPGSAPTDILYASYLDATITSVSTGNTQVGQFRMRDGGVTHTDLDGSPTTLNNITFSVTGSANLQRVALFNGATLLAEQAASSTMSFNGISFSTTGDGVGTDALLTVKVSFKNVVTDNAQIGFQITSASSTTNACSLFAAPDAGGASTPTSPNNLVEVLASKYFFTTPVMGSLSNSVLASVTMTTAPASGGLGSVIRLEARDANNNLDLDYNRPVNVTNVGNLKMTDGGVNTSVTSITTYSYSSGVLTFPAGFKYDITGNGTLNVADQSPAIKITNLTAPASPPITVSSSSGSDIVVDLSGTFLNYNQNIQYINYPQSNSNISPGNPSNPNPATDDEIKVAQFKIRDGGALANDLDHVGTELTNITFAITNYQNINRLALYDGNTKLGVDFVVGGTSSTATFGPFSTIAGDDGTKILSLFATFTNGVTDNAKIAFQVTSATANPATSTFTAPDAGGASTPNISANDDNRLEVVATELDFTAPTAPSPVSINTIVYPVIKARDINANVDLDFTGTNGIVTAFSNNASPTAVTMSNGPMVGTTQFASGVLDFSVAFPGFQFTTGDNNETFTVSITGTGGISGSSPTLTLKTNTITSGVITNPIISSLADDFPHTPGGTNVFDFKINDDDNLISGTDGLPTLISQIKITQLAGNDIADWRQIIASATLTDGIAGNTVTGIINSTTGMDITFNLNSSPGATGYITDNNSKTYTLNIVLLSSLGGSLPSTADHQNLAFEVLASNISIVSPGTASSTFSTSGISTEQNSGATNNAIDVIATKLKWTTEPASPASPGAPLLVNKDISLQLPVPVIEALDVDNNRDLDYVTSLNISDAGSLPMSSTNLTQSSVTTLSLAAAGTAPLTGGIYNFPNDFQFNSIGDGTMTAVPSAATTVITTDPERISTPVTVRVGVASTITTDLSLEPSTISSLIDLTHTPAGQKVFNFTINDDPGLAANDPENDGNPTQISSITITQGSGNTITNWQEVFSQVQIDDGTGLPGHSGPGTINPTSLVFGSVSGPIPNALLTDPGYIADNGNKTYTLTVWLKTDLSGTQNYPITIDGLRFVFEVLQANIGVNINGTSIKPGETKNSDDPLHPGNEMVAVVATQLDITTPSTAISASLNVPIAPIIVESRDVNQNRDLDFNGIITAYTKATPADSTINRPTVGVTHFTNGAYTFPSTFTFITGVNGDNVALRLRADNTGGSTGVTCGVNAICSGISPTITLQTSFESFITKDPTFVVPATIPYVTHQETNLTGSSYELIRVLLLDGSRSSAATYGVTHAPLQFQTLTDTDGQLHGDTDGADTHLGSITIQISNPSNLRTIGLFDKNGVQLGSQIDVAGMHLTSGTAPQPFTFTGNSLIIAPDDSSAVFSVRASFNNTANTVNDGDDIQIQLTSASTVLGSGSDFYDNNPNGNPPGPGGPYIGGQVASVPHSIGLIDVVTTSLDFTTQPSSYAGINEPIGIDPSTTQAYSFGNPATFNLMPTTSPGTVTARDKYALVDTGFAPFSLSMTNASNNSILIPASFVNGVLSLNGMRYANVGNGKLTVIAIPKAAGTITTSTGSTIVTGVGTNFIDQLNVGSVIKDPSGNLIGTVLSIESSISLTLVATANITLAASNYSYTIVNSSTPTVNTAGTITSSTGSATISGVGTLFTTDVKVGSLINDVNGNLIGTVLSIGSNTSLTLNANALIAVTGASYNENSIPSHIVNVLDVTATYNSAGLVSATNGKFSLKGGTPSQPIFGLTFTANATAGSEPYLKRFTIGFKAGPGSPTAALGNNWYFNNNTGISVFPGTGGGAVNPTGWQVLIDGNDVTSSLYNGKVILQESTPSSGYFDQVVVDFTQAGGVPQSLASGSHSFIFKANVSSTTNSSTQTLIPYFIDAGYGTQSDQNTIVSNGTATALSNGATVGEIDGTEYSFASTKPPKLLASKVTSPNTLTSPYAGQPNVNPNLQQVTLQFDTNVGVLDGPGQPTGAIYDRLTNTKVADLLFDTTNPPQQVQAQVVSQTIQDNYASIRFNVIDPATNLTPTLAYDHVYYINIVQGKYDFSANNGLGAGTGISDYGLNFFGGLNDNSTLYFKTWNNTPPNLASAQSTFNSTTLGTLSTTFDQQGTAYYVVVPSGTTGITPSYIKSPPPSLPASGSFAITVVNTVQTVTFPANFSTSQNYDVYIAADNNATPVYSSGIYTPLSPSSYVAGAGPTLNILGTSIFDPSVPTSTSPTPTNGTGTSALIYSLCPNSYTTITQPMIITEPNPSGIGFFGGLSGDQNFNILLPPGYEFDINVAPVIQTIGADFKSLVSTPSAQWAYTYSSNTVLQVSFNNSGSLSWDYITISGLSIIGKTDPVTLKTPGQGNIQWFYGRNIFTSTNPVFTLAQVKVITNPTPDFTNSYWYNNELSTPFPLLASDGNEVTAIQKTVNVIPVHYNDPSNPGSIRLLPITPPYNLYSQDTFGAGDYLASTFSGTGVSGDLLTLNAVPQGAAFDITMNHTDLSGCATVQTEQYLVYNDQNAISNKLGTAYPAGSSLAGTEQALVNTNFPGNASAIASPSLADNELAGYQLLQLTTDLPASELALNAASSSSQIISNSWRTLIQKSIIKTTAPWTWDYSAILNAQTDTNPPTFPSGISNVYDFFKSPNKSPLNYQYWTGGSLGKVEFTGVYQSTADHTVYAPFRQNVELFVPAIPVMEVTSPKPFYDVTDVNPKNQPNGPAFISSIYSTYPGTATFCEQGGTINISGYPLASAGKSSGSFGLYNYSTYNYSGVVVPSGIITTLSTSAGVVGNPSTKFTTELVANGTLYDPQGNFIGQILSITDDQHLTLSANAKTVVTSNTFRANNNVPILLSGSSAFVDNGNGTMILDPTKPSVQNGYSDMLVTYMYQDNISPAFGIGYLVIRITPNPVASFSIASAVSNPGPSATDAFCKNSLIAFTSTGTLASASQNFPNSIDTYSWNFGDQNASNGNPNTASTASATHVYNASATYSVLLQLTSHWGCQSQPVIILNTTSQTTYAGTQGNVIVGDVPVPSFSFLGNCVGDAISFTDHSTLAGTNSSISKWSWDFGDNSNLGSGAGTSHQYATAGEFSVKLTATTNVAGADGCQNSLSKNLVQLPLQSPTASGAYQSHFDVSNGGWIALNADTVKGGSGSWAWGQTTGKKNQTFNTSSNLWVTSLSGTFNANEKSSLYSVCLDLSNLPRPMISYSSFVDLAPNAEGLVLEYSFDTYNVTDFKHKSWNVLGSYDRVTGLSDGLDWYTAAGLPSVPGDVAFNATGEGWSGIAGKTPTWINPKHELDDVQSSTAQYAVSNGVLPRVILRFALSTLTNSDALDGVGIDGVFIGSRTRTILLENFTSTDAGTSNADVLADATAITAFVKTNLASTQLVNINYHVGFIGTDPFNMDDPADPSSRALYYNVKNVPYAFLDGSHYTGTDPTTQKSSDLFKYWGQAQYDLNTLQLANADFLDPGSNTKLTTVTANSDGSLQVDVNFTPVIDLPFGVRGGTVLQVAILEKSITQLPTTGKITTGETSFGYVLRKMLPNAAGTKFNTPILGIESNGTTHPVSAGSFTWIPDNLHNSDSLTVVVFLQNEDTKEVYQAFIQSVPTPVSVTTAIEPITADNIKVYPNPSDQEFTIELPYPAQQSMKVTMANQLGQFTEMGTLGEGEQSKKISTNGLAEGVYILQLGSNGNALRTKIVVLHK